MKTSRYYIAALFAVALVVLNAPTRAQTTDGLTLWLKADAITGLSDGSPVAAWPDSSGQVLDAVAPAGFEPTFVLNGLGGLPVVRFADPTGGTSGYNYLDSSLTMNGNNSPFTILAVFKANRTGVRDTLLQTLDNGGNTGRTVLYEQADPGNIERIWSFASGTSLGSTNVYVTNGWRLVTLVQDPAGAGSLTLFWDGVISTVSPLSAVAPSGAWRIGCGKNLAAAPNALNGAIAEVMVFNKVLPEAERQRNEDYLRQKWFPPVSLTVARAANKVTLSWPASAAEYVLQAKDDLSFTNWTSLPGPYTVNGNRCETNPPAMTPQQFYRLQLP